MTKDGSSRIQSTQVRLPSPYISIPYPLTYHRRPRAAVTCPPPVLPLVLKQRVTSLLTSALETRRTRQVDQARAVLLLVVATVVVKDARLERNRRVVYGRLEGEMVGDGWGTFVDDMELLEVLFVKLMLQLSVWKFSKGVT